MEIKGSRSMGELGNSGMGKGVINRTKRQIKSGMVEDIGMYAKGGNTGSRMGELGEELAGKVWTRYNYKGQGGKGFQSQEEEELKGCGSIIRNEKRKWRKHKKGRISLGMRVNSEEMQNILVGQRCLGNGQKGEKWRERECGI